MTKITHNGTEFDFDAAVNLMDDDIREDIHDIGTGDEQSFFDAYCAAHLAKFGSEFVVN